MSEYDPCLVAPTCLYLHLRWRRAQCKPGFLSSTLLQDAGITDLTQFAWYALLLGTNNSASTAKGHIYLILLLGLSSLL
ncbi:hypothetical protein BS78_06G025300 [Paspalum vaginatum]|nr:hypothetical protein BS78_06G025300 [Paspalum vaginatum]